MATDAPPFEAYAAEAVPQAAVGSPGKDGRLELTVRETAGGSALVRDYATAPFHVSGTLDHDPHPDVATVIVQSSSGGVAQGDRRDIDVAVGTNALAHVSTGGSTKVQSMEHNCAAADVSLSVGSNGHLEYVPEPTILQANARYHVSLALDLAADATPILGDVVVPGRLARGERFEFERYLSRVHATGPDGIVFEDATHLTPGEAEVAARLSSGDPHHVVLSAAHERTERRLFLS